MICSRSAPAFQFVHGKLPEVSDQEENLALKWTLSNVERTPYEHSSCALFLQEKEHGVPLAGHSPFISLVFILQFAACTKNGIFQREDLQ